jgi:hypothetical protein
VTGFASNAERRCFFKSSGGDIHLRELVRVHGVGKRLQTSIMDKKAVIAY